MGGERGCSYNKKTDTSIVSVFMENQNYDASFVITPWIIA